MKGTTHIGNSLFDDLTFVSDEVETIKKQKLDLFKMVLPAIARGDMDFYDNLTEAQQKGYEPYVIARWLSNTSDSQHTSFLMNTNDIVNVDFWTLSAHPGLQHRLMCIVHALSASKRPNHKWLNFMGGKRAKSEINTFILDRFPGLNDQEIDILKATWTDEDFESFVKSYGVQDAELNKLMKAWSTNKAK